MILGIDEVGRGPWAGPLVIGAVVLDEHVCGIEGLTDSKKLTDKRRRELDLIIREKALGFGMGWVQADELDRIGLSEALRVATIRAVEQIKVPYHEIIIDGTINFLKETSKGAFVTTLPKADALIPAVSAAAIIAKVARDTFMAEQDALYPDYGFGAHVGYGTARHRSALESFGVTPLHRQSFAPIKALLGIQTELQKSEQTLAKSAGNEAESLVAEYLVNKGYTILERNWKNRYCEIDIVGEYKGKRYFIEVKYRSSADQGGGLAAITPVKQRQMAFAAELYTAKTRGHQLPRQLAVAAVTRNKEVTYLELS